MLENYVLNNNGSRDDAADVIQETIVAFIEIVEQGKFRGDSSIKSFLFAITRNVWLTELRKKRQRRITGIRILKKKKTYWMKEPLITLLNGNIFW
jgi:RNA polymerase sigma factor (sigma-70 family)